MRFGIPVLALFVAVLVWFNQFQEESVAAATQRATDLLDSRPARSILIVGNSRTYFNGMPAMLRKIADSAGSPTKFQIEVSAYPGAKLADHWANKRSRQLLGEGWDEIILQAESAAQSNGDARVSFQDYGNKLAGIAKVNHGHPRLVVNWAYDPILYEGDLDGQWRAQHIEQIRWSHAKLASDTGMSTIKLSGLWEAVRQAHPSIKLTSDGNHPTIAGSYLYALALYASLSNGPVTAVTYVPQGVSPDEAKAIRDAVDAYPLLA
jgi:hypothetical protein